MSLPQLERETSRLNEVKCVKDFQTRRLIYFLSSLCLLLLLLRVFLFSSPLLLLLLLVASSPFPFIAGAVVSLGFSLFYWMERVGVMVTLKNSLRGGLVGGKWR